MNFVATVVIVGLVLGLMILGGNYLLEQRKNEQSKNTNVATLITNVRSDAPLTPPSPTLTPKPKVTKPAVIEQPANENLYQNTNSVLPTPATSRTIVNNTLTIEAEHYKSIKFNLDTPARIVGRVEASGGNNDIDTIVLDSDEFTNFQNTGNYRSFYHSGYVTIGNINLTLSPGSYYVIFSNSKSIFTNKIVRATVAVQ
ncbi:MAG: hypothetical protein M3033_01505 [Acidobacteriota bacterium]|nr:hypothetical protein [Acidobacteriota bacterium]